MSAQPGNSLIGITRRPPATREYVVHVFRHGHRFEFWPGKVWHSNLRIRAFAHVFFVKWFGRQPDRRRNNWHKDGFMAECGCRRGFIVQVEQVNHGDPSVRQQFALSTWTADRMAALFQKGAA